MSLPAGSGSPPDGYEELKLDEEEARTAGGSAAPRVERAGAAPDRHRWKGPDTGPGFSRIAGKPRSAAPVLLSILAACLALVAVGVWQAMHRGGVAPPEAPQASPAAPEVPGSTAVLPAPPLDRPVEAAPAPAPADAAAPSRIAATPPPATAQDHRRTSHVASAAPMPAPAPAPAVARPSAAPAPAADAGRDRSAPAGAAAIARTEPAVAAAAAATPPAAPAAPAAAAPAAPAAPVVEDAPRYPSEGFKKPRLEEPTCVQDGLRLPRDAAERTGGRVTVQFAVGPDGAVSRFEVLGAPVERRVLDAIRSAVRACRFVPGADAQGRPTSLWVVMPLRFGG